MTPKAIIPLPEAMIHTASMKVIETLFGLLMIVLLTAAAVIAGVVAVDDGVLAGIVFFVIASLMAGVFFGFALFGASLMIRLFGPPR